MCRLLLFNVVRDAEKDSRLEAGRYQQGNVVCVLEDDQDPGSDIWKLGYWRVIDLPGVKKAEMEYLASPMLEDIDKSKLPRKRAIVLDVNALPISTTPLTKDGGPKLPNGPQDDAVAAAAVIQPESLDKQTIVDATVLVDYVADVAQIGPDPMVIGP